jgi:hypothetical protein
MEPKKVGRTLGIGVRVASKMVRERVAQAQAAPSSAEAPQYGPSDVENSPATPHSRPPIASQAAAAKRGAKAFGRAIVTPFTHAGSILWLEITGLFFALFSIFFIQNVYRVHAAWRQGPDHTHLLLYVVLAAVFAWFSVSSFTRAWRKGRQGAPSSEPRP